MHGLKLHLIGCMISGCELAKPHLAVCGREAASPSVTKSSPNCRRLDARLCREPRLSPDCSQHAPQLGTASLASGPHSTRPSPCSQTTHDITSSRGGGMHRFCLVCCIPTDPWLNHVLETTSTQHIPRCRHWDLNRLAICCPAVLCPPELCWNALACEHLVPPAVTPPCA